MMPTRHASARWSGNLKTGSGSVETQSGLVHGSYSYLSRFADTEGSNPEELLAASHAACYAMALSLLLTNEGCVPRNVEAVAHVTLAEVGGQPTITNIMLTTEGDVPDIDRGTFERIAQDAKDFCPISRALDATEIVLKASLKNANASLTTYRK